MQFEEIDDFHFTTGAPSAPTPVAPKSIFQEPVYTYPIPELNLFAPPYSIELAEERRERLLTKKHTIAEKMQLYNCSTQGKVEELRSLLTEKGYSVSEEVSKEGHYWTVLHYASHYGHLKVLEYLMDYIKDKD